MTTPTFPLETAVGWFSLTVVDERCIIAKAPASGQALLIVDGDELGVAVELRPDPTGVWRPREPKDLLMDRRGHGGVRFSSKPDQRLQQTIVEALAEAVTAWAIECPILLATAAAFNQDATLHRSRRVTVARITTKD